MNPIVLALALRIAAVPDAAPPAPYLYRTTLLQAAPGQAPRGRGDAQGGLAGGPGGGRRGAARDAAQPGRPLGPHAPLPDGELGRVLRRRPDREARPARARRRRATLARLADDVAWQEDVFAWGPPLAQVRGAFEKAGFFHVEMFEALPGKEKDLDRQREMENDYSKRLGLPQNLIFVRDAGAPWTLFTIGAYRDLKHYAESADVPEAKSEEAARAAGFDGAKAIGPYLRTLIALHHDTLAVAIR